ncbi:hypothetical protein [Bacillus sp. UMB0893]|uniref:hypothetical protein n=1 Tax=Bacillus sp. UMB0893 TaxID=2066053 RepID=UPI000C768F34|nr:hypothetical protein [Bacillus sp. UMB0893]PLR66898.1 hypothetical protein CYJ36_16695 [Bacillus sp. UMB0893]QNG61586.1 hypothetical protein H4O14_08965 [Bacillus sp. PAMC26568]
MRVELSPEQKKLRKLLKVKVAEILDFLSLTREERRSQSYEKIEKVYEEMGSTAHKLHLTLDPKPKLHRETIRIRGMKPEHPEFYHHVRPVEELLNYLDNINANDEPEDQTLGKTFHLDVYTRKWGHYDRYTLIRNEEGWLIQHMSQSEQAGRDAEPILSYVLRHDHVSYPRNLSSIMEDIWYRAAEEGLTEEQVQGMLKEVSEWISMTEQNYPSHIALKKNKQKGYFS